LIHSLHKTLFTAALAAAALLPLRASDGRIPVSGQTTISQPGSYYITQNFSVASGNCVLINVSGVSLDLDGHTLTTNGSDCISAVNQTQLSVANGKIVVNAFSNTSAIYFMIITANPAAIGVRVTGNNTNASTAVIEHSQVYNTNYGINLNLLAGGFVTDNTVNKCNNSCIQVGLSSGVDVSRNTVSNGATNGIALVSNHCQVNNNTVSGFAGVGLYFTSGAIGNVLRFNAVSNGTLASGTGIRVDFSSTGNTLDGNSANYNLGSGILFDASSTGNIYGNNRAVGNGAPGNFSISASNRTAGGNCDPTGCAF
jgi:parallel beta-helix repeat protein